MQQVTGGAENKALHCTCEKKSVHTAFGSIKTGSGGIETGPG